MPRADVTVPSVAERLRHSAMMVALILCLFARALNFDVSEVSELRHGH